jgi:uncharacterized membrane protein YcaP (DUF421 family)
MDTVVRTAVVYFFLLVLFRLAGKRTVSELDTFDMVILLIISESTQGALVGKDNSLTTFFLVTVTMVGAGLILAFVKQKSEKMSRLIDGLPVVLMKDGKLLRDRMDKLRVDEADILEAAHLQEGLGTLEDIRYAILERNGDIAVIPKR